MSFQVKLHNHVILRGNMNFWINKLLASEVVIPCLRHLYASILLTFLPRRVERYSKIPSCFGFWILESKHNDVAAFRILTYIQHTRKYTYLCTSSLLSQSTIYNIQKTSKINVLGKIYNSFLQLENSKHCYQDFVETIRTPPVICWSVTKVIKNIICSPQ